MTDTTNSIELLTDKVCCQYHLAKKEYAGKISELFKKICEEVYKEHKLEHSFESISVFTGVISKVVASRRPKKNKTQHPNKIITHSVLTTPLPHVPFVPEFSRNENDGAAFVAGQIESLGLNPDSY